MLSDSGRREEALAAAQEAVGIYRATGRPRPDAFLPDLAMSLNNLANRLSDFGPAGGGAGRRRRRRSHSTAQLAQARPDAFLPELWPMSLNNLANMLSDLGPAGGGAGRGAGGGRHPPRNWPAARPDAFLPDLAVSCGTRGAVLIGMGRQSEAAASFAQGIRALTPLFQKTPTAFAELMNKLCANYLQAMQQAKADPDTVLLAPVQEVFEKLKKNQPKK